MKKRFINRENIEGHVFTHELEVKVSQRQDSKIFGQEYINGNLMVATDEDGLNVLTIHYRCVMPTTKDGKINQTFTALKKIITENKTWLEVGKDECFKVRCSPTLEVNDFYSNRDNTLVSAKVNEGGFVTIIKDLAPKVDERNTFDIDIIVNKVTMVEADPERGIEDHLKINGVIFNYRKEVMPVELIARDERAFGYFDGLDISSKNPVATELRGLILATTIQREIKEESAFGDPIIRTVERTTREWLVTWAKTIPYDFGDENIITAEELKEALQNRELHLAEVKKNHDDYVASRGTVVKAASAPATETVTIGDFNF